MTLIIDPQTMNMAAPMPTRREDRIDFNVDDLMTTETCWLTVERLEEVAVGTLSGGTDKSRDELEDDLSSQLKDASTRKFTRDRLHTTDRSEAICRGGIEGRARQRRSSQSCVTGSRRCGTGGAGMVEYIGCLCPELKLRCLPDGKVLEDREVVIREARSV